MITGAVFVDLSAAYDMVNHRRLLSKVLYMTCDVHLTDLIGTMLESRRFFVVLNEKKSRWRRQRNGLPQGSVLAPMLFNVYTKDQPIHTTSTPSKRLPRLPWALCPPITTRTNCVRTLQRHVCAYPLRNREAKRELNVVRTVPDSQTQQHQCIWASTLTELCAIKRTSRRQHYYEGEREK